MDKWVIKLFNKTIKGKRDHNLSKLFNESSELYLTHEPNLYNYTESIKKAYVFESTEDYINMLIHELNIKSWDFKFISQKIYHLPHKDSFVDNINVDNLWLNIKAINQAHDIVYNIYINERNK